MLSPTRVRIPATDLALLLDLPDGVQIVTPGGEPAEDIELFIHGEDLPVGDARLVYEMDDIEVPSLVAIESVQRDG